MRKIVEDADAAIELLGETPTSREASEDLTLGRAALIARRTRRQLEALAEQKHQLEEERALQTLEARDIKPHPGPGEDQDS